MKKKVLVTVVSVLSFVGFLLFCSNIFAKSDDTIMDSGNQEGGERIKCHCTTFGRCKARGAGNNCAQSQPGGNIQCSDYNGNC